MSRLPQIGGDDGNWGDILNDYLRVEHAADGTLNQLNTLSQMYEKPADGIPESDLAVGITDVLNGLLTDRSFAVNAAIDQTKIAGLAAALAAKLDATDGRLSDQRITTAHNGTATGPKRPRLSLTAGSNLSLTVSDNAVTDSVDVVASLRPTGNLTPNWVNVKDYGAKGDKGTTNNTAYFQAAIADLKARGGGVLFIPRGWYSLTAGLDISGGIRLVGDGDTILSWSDLGGSAASPTFALDMQPTAPQSGSPGSVENLTLYGPGGATAGQRSTWTNGIRISRGGLVRDLEVSGWSAAFYLQYGREQIQNVRAGGFYTAYFTSSDPDSGGQHFSDSEFLGNLSSVGVAPTGAILNCYMTGIQLGHSPYAFYKEGPAQPGYDTFISGLTMVGCSVELAGYGLFVAGDNSGSGQTIENLTNLGSSSYNLMNPYIYGGGQPAISIPYPHSAAVICGTIRNWSMVGGQLINPISNGDPSQNVPGISCNQMINVKIDQATTGNPSTPYIVCSGEIKGVEMRTRGWLGGRVKFRPIKATATIQPSDVVEADGSGCRPCTTGVPLGVCVDKTTKNAGDVVLVAYSGAVGINIVQTTGLAWKSHSWLKPDPANPGCVMLASGPQDGAVMATNFEAPASGTVSSILFRLG